MAMRETDIHDVPPPPYSETDIYSTSGRRSHPSSSSPHVPSHHGGDDAASRVSSHASSHSEVIYTPPLTPRTSGTSGTSGGGLHHNDSNSSLFNRAQVASAPSSSAYLDFAAAYFESRPAPACPPRDRLVHALTVTPTSTSDDVPCPPTWAARDVTQQDWATFTNCLIPHHTAARNEAVINRKLQAEEEAIAAAAAASNGGRGNNGTSGAPSNSSSHASAQLDQIRSDPDTDPGAAAAASGLRREDVEAVVAQWNEGFFRPRGVAVMLNVELEELRMPGAWDRSFDRSVESPTIAGGGGSGGPNPMPFPSHPGPGPVMQPQPGPTESRSSWSFGGITVTTDGISIGDRIVADSNGIRVGNLIADENGIRFGSNTTPRAQPHYVGPNPNWAPPLAPAPPGPAPMFGPGPGPFPHGPHHQPVGHPTPHEHPFFQGGHGHSHIRSGSGSGGRGRPPGRYPSGQRSPSASSSASSISSTSSASSVGSLPDYEDLYPAQLPIYKQRVASWLSHPDQPVTKADIAQFREEIRSAHAASDASERQRRDGRGAPAAALNKADEKALKADLKALAQEWRKLKRQQRAIRKEKRRERRARRREEKRERREQKRESRQGQRGVRREQGGVRRGGGGGDGGGRENHHQHHHHHHHGPGPMHTPSPWGAPVSFVPPPPPQGVHIPPPPVMHTPPMPVVPTIAPNVPNSLPWGAGRGRGFALPGGFPGGGGPWSAGFGRGWGRDHGPGGEHAFPFNGGPPPPGAWPVGGGGERSPGASTPPVPPSQGLLKAVEEMEKDIARRVEELDQMRNEIRDNNPGRGRCGNGRGRGRGSCGRGDRGDETARRLEEEIDTLSRNVEKLKIEADAEFARELAAEDGKSGGW